MTHEFRVPCIVPLCHPLNLELWLSSPSFPPSTLAGWSAEVIYLHRDKLTLGEARTYTH